MKKELKVYGARHKKTHKFVEFSYTTMKEAKAKNPNFFDWRLIGYVR